MSMHTSTREKAFEDEIVAHLVANGWRQGDPAQYDQARALYPDDVLGWLHDTQPNALARITPPAGRTVDEVVLDRLAEVLHKQGAVRTLRDGFKHVSARFDLSQPRPTQALNPDTLTRYQQMRCTVVRQVHYSQNKSRDSIDLVLFVNGIPVATAELKTDFNQSVDHAIAQYRRDRPPKDPATNSVEPLLAGKRAFVHFAVSTSNVAMTTKLAGDATSFLPFDRGADGGAGNPPDPSSGYQTAYLWEQIWQRDIWLDLLANFVHVGEVTKTTSKGEHKQQEALIFPRYHQWEAVKQLLAATRAEGPGHNYLVQHSAGSGKSNTIAWLAYRLATLHDAADQQLFNTVIVVTDRNVLDRQLQETITQFAHKRGFVVPIKEHGRPKSEQLRQAFQRNPAIIIVTVQTFPFALDAINADQLLAGRRFAVIADEAHSSQSGTAASGLSRVLTGGGSASSDPDEAPDVEDLLLAAMTARANHGNISYYAFTATPKAKTLEVFGRPADPAAPLSPLNPPTAFHLYTMRQAIDEGFILDVLQNYTPYRLAFRLAHNGVEYDDRQVDQAKARKRLLQWVRLHPHNIAQKVKIIVEHFRENVQGLLPDKNAKAMVVTASRKEAVRYKLAIDQYIREQHYHTLATLVAFSGEVDDPESGPDPFTEANMNPRLRGRDLREVFRDECQILIVANKYQTGFDQPLLCAMYVDKRLAGITAVQTLSRLNRTAPGKETTYILDFVNEPEEILDAFRPYYLRSELASITDPNIIHELQTKLDDQHLYTDEEVNNFATVCLNPKAKQGTLLRYLRPAIQEYRQRQGAIEARPDGAQEAARSELAQLRKDLQSFVHAYDFLSQIIDYGDTDLEKRALFFRHLLPHLHAVWDVNDPLDLSGVQLTHYRLRDQGWRQLPLHDKPGEYLLWPLTALGTGQPHDPRQEKLSAIIAQVNELFEGDLADIDKLSYFTTITNKVADNPTVQQQARVNSKEQFALGTFPNALREAIFATHDSHTQMTEQVLNNQQKWEELERLVLNTLWEQIHSAAPTES